MKKNNWNKSIQWLMKNINNELTENFIIHLNYLLLKG